MSDVTRLWVTTSWDDGDPDDLRVAAALTERGLSGTFYLCRSFDGTPRLTPGDIGSLAAMPGIEIGSHTLTHPDLRQLSRIDLREELVGSKQWLEDLVGRDVEAFCYPRGLQNRRVRRATADAGYTFARTTRSTAWTLPQNPYLVPTTMQLYPHRRSTQVRHAVKERDVVGLRNLLTLRGWSTNPGDLVRSLATAARHAGGGVLHIWGHSWELRDEALWARFHEVLDVLRDTPGAIFGTNSEVLGR